MADEFVGRFDAAAANRVSTFAKRPFYFEATGFFEDGLLRQAQEMAEHGYRVLVIAAGSLSNAGDLAQFDESHLADLVVLGLVGFIDPLRPEVRDAVAVSRQAGVKVIMITGDHPATALAIAKELQITESVEHVISGQELNEIVGYDTPEFYERIKHVTVFARVTPQQKLHIVDGLVKLGEFVAVTGDGVNDAPALTWLSHSKPARRAL